MSYRIRRRRRRFHLAQMLFAATAACPVAGVVAQTTQWLNSTDVNNDWTVGANWSNGLPTTGRTAAFDLNASYSVAFTASQPTAPSLAINAGGVTLALAGQTLSVSDDIDVADDAGETAALTLVGGTVTSSNGRILIGGGNVGTGTLTLKSGAALVESGFSSDIFIGSMGGVGSVTVDGVNSRLATGPQSVLIYVGGDRLNSQTGLFSDGSLTVTNGGSATTAQGIVVGYAGARGRIVVDGAGSSVTTGDLIGLRVGEGRSSTSGLAGEGTILVRNGGALVTTGRSILGLNGGVARLEVVGAGSKYETERFIVGVGTTVAAGSTHAANGSISVSGGGLLITAQTSFVGGSGGTGSIVLDGFGTTWTLGNGLQIGNGTGANAPGTGSLRIQNGAVVSQATSSTAAIQVYAGGSLTVTSGATLVAKNLNLSAAGAFDMAGGTIVLTGNGTLTTPTGGLVVPATGTLGGHAKVAGNLTVDGTLRASLGGTTFGQFDQLALTGTLDVSGGTLDLQLANGYLPTYGDQFILVVNDASDAITGAFANQLTDSELGFQYIVDSGWKWRLDFAAGDGNNLTITAVPEPSLTGLGVLAGAATFRRRRCRPVVG